MRCILVDNNQLNNRVTTDWTEPFCHWHMQHRNKMLNWPSCWGQSFSSSWIIGLAFSTWLSLWHFRISGFAPPSFSCARSGRMLACPRSCALCSFRLQLSPHWPRRNLRFLHWAGTLFILLNRSLLDLTLVITNMKFPTNIWCWDTLNKKYLNT